MWGLVLAAVVTSAAAADTSARVEGLAVTEPRPFGYFIGDALHRDIALTLKPGARLETASLPRPGPVNYWLELRSINVEERGGGTRIGISLEYQTFYSALDPRRLTIPGFSLKVADATGSEDAEVPPFSFVVSPLRELFPGKETEGSAVELRPDAVAPLLATAPARTALLAAALVACAALTLLAAHHALGPFGRRPGRPFTQAARFLRSNRAHLVGDGGYRAALVKLHRAFDAAAGHRLLPDDLAAFLREHPEYRQLSGDIERLFQCSRTAFYGNDVARARAAMPLEAIAELGSRLGAAERRAA